MRQFSVLAPVSQLEPAALQLVLDAFQFFFEEITPKHRKNVRLVLLASTAQAEAIRRHPTPGNLKPPLEVITMSQIELAEQRWGSADLCFLPASEGQAQVLQKALQHQLPILAFDNKVVRTLCDHTCSVQISLNTQNPERDFADTLRMLYFDPGARKMLVKGALKKWNQSLRETIE